MAKRLLLIEGSEERLSLLEKEIAKNKSELGYNIVDIGYNYDEDASYYEECCGWSFARFKLGGFVKAIPLEWIKDYVGSGVSDDIFQRNRRFVLNMIKDWEKENET